MGCKHCLHAFNPSLDQLLLLLLDEVVVSVRAFFCQEHFMSVFWNQLLCRRAAVLCTVACTVVLRCHAALLKQRLVHCIPAYILVKLFDLALMILRSMK